MTEMLGASPLVRALGVALVEFLWQGALLAAIAGGLLVLMRRSTASARYVVACAALAAMAAAPVLTAWNAYTPERGLLVMASEVVTASSATAGAGTRAATFI